MVDKAKVSILDLFEEEEDQVHYFYNGMPDYWHEMPEFIQNEHDGIGKKISIIFHNEDDITKFGKDVLGVENFWRRKNWNGKGVWYPLKDHKRNSNLRYIQKEEAEAHPELYEIVPTSEIKP
jgi:hypothetical protein